MSEDLKPPSLVEVTGYPWESVAGRAETPICFEMAQCLSSEAATLETAGDLVGANVYRFLCRVAFMGLDPNNDQQPFEPAVQGQTFRSITLSDYGPGGFDLLRALIPLTKTPAVRAQFCDLLWIARRDKKTDHLMAHQAAEDYLATFQVVDRMEHWVRDIKGLERGMNLAADLGEKKPLFKSYVEYIEQRLSQLESTCDNAFALRLFGLFMRYRIRDFDRWAKMAESIGDRLEQVEPSFLGRYYYDQAISFLQMSKDIEEAKRIGRKKGESLVSQADVCVDRPGQGYLAAAGHLATAIQCLQHAGADKDRILDLRKRLRDFQQRGNGEMQTFVHEWDPSELIVRARKLMEGKSLEEGILHMALRHPTIDVEALRKQVIENADENPLQSIFGASRVNPEGLPIGNRPSGLSSDPKEWEKFVEAEMFHLASRSQWLVRAVGYIEPCREVIWKEHRPCIEDLGFWFIRTPSFPQDRQCLS